MLGLGEDEVSARETGLRWKVVVIAERSAGGISGGKAGNPVRDRTALYMYVRDAVSAVLFLPKMAITYIGCWPRCVVI